MPRFSSLQRLVAVGLTGVALAMTLAACGAHDTTTVSSATVPDQQLGGQELSVGADPISMDQLSAQSSAIVLGRVGHHVGSEPAAVTPSPDEKPWLEVWQLYEFFPRSVIHGKGVTVSNTPITVSVLSYQSKPGGRQIQGPDGMLKEGSNLVLALGPQATKAVSLKVLYGTAGEFPVQGTHATGDLTSVSDADLASLVLAADPAITGLAQSATKPLTMSALALAASKAN